MRREGPQEAGLLAGGGRVDFNYHVKPILSDKCFACHGPDEKKRDSGLRLDTEAGAFAALKDDPHAFA
ncbi:MAG TPA: c-type cytochrome domain-containing protein, partial [Cytophagales bacterium]